MATVLIVDDRVDASRMTIRALEQAGHTVISATTGEETHSLYAEKLPDVVVIELSLASDEGVVVIRELLEEHPLAQIIATTATALALLRTAKEIGVAATLKRPFRDSQLVDLVERLSRTAAG